MNVELTFTPDDLELRDVGPETEEALLFHTTLVVQVGLRVGDRQLLAIDRAPAGSQPIVGTEASASWVAAAPIPASGAPQPVIGFLCKTRDCQRRPKVEQESPVENGAGQCSFSPVSTSSRLPRSR
jgi:hypothetical protein